VYGAPYMTAQADLLVDERLVLRGPSPDALRRQACLAFDDRLGEQSWRFGATSFLPCLVSIGGRVRLYEGRFEAVRP
jgi:hypothetical protein